MEGLIILILFLLVGPLAMLFGADSRTLDERDQRGWVPGGARGERVPAVRAPSAPASRLPAPAARQARPVLGMRAQPRIAGR